MTEVKLFRIGNIAGLFEVIDNCIGSVYLKAGKNTKLELRKNDEVKKLLFDACSGNGIEKMSVVVKDRRDMPEIINFLISYKQN